MINVCVYVCVCVGVCVCVCVCGVCVCVCVWGGVGVWGVSVWVSVWGYVCNNLTILVLASCWLKNVTYNSNVAPNFNQGARRAATFPYH